MSMEIVAVELQGSSSTSRSKCKESCLLLAVLECRQPVPLAAFRVEHPAQGVEEVSADNGDMAVYLGTITAPSHCVQVGHRDRAEVLAVVIRSEVALPDSGSHRGLAITGNRGTASATSNCMVYVSAGYSDSGVA